jgi:hypothetical protein
MSAPASRHRDPTSSYSLDNRARHPIDVVCPRCAAHGRVIAEPGTEELPTTCPRRLVCAGCGHTAIWSPRGRSVRREAGRDPFFRQPLWLSATVRGHLLWAYNREHLDVLAAFVAAGLRERGPYGNCSMSMIERLPAWIKFARNRDDVLSTVVRLRARLDEPSRAGSRHRRP